MRLFARSASHEPRARGFTLIEVAISASIFAVVSVGAVVFFRGTMQSMDESAQSSRVLNVASAGLTYLQRDFALSTPSHISIASVSPCCDEVRLQVPIDLDAAGPVWGAVSAKEIEVDGSPRQRHPGWQVRYHVEGSLLLRDLLDEEGEPVAGTALVIARDLLPDEIVSGSARGGTAAPKIFRIWQPQPQQAERIYAGALTTALPVIDANGRPAIGPWKEHRTTLRAERN
jgi:prepilin-type N-terminal cleavage/methylation domain-containing protein